MPRLNFAEPAVPTSARWSRLGSEGRPCSLSDDEIARLSSLGLTTLEVAHDLRNLLQVAGSAVHLIDRHLEEGSRAHLGYYIGGALASIERASALSRRILDTARPRSQGNSMVYADTVLSDMRGEIALAAGSSIQVIMHCGDIIPAILCHRPDLENAILNLVVNARDAMGGQGRLSLIVTRDDGVISDSRHRADVVLSVADTGCGMPAHVAAQAFRPFFTTKPRDRGTGLGLAMVGAFAGRLGGTADIASIVGEGTTVTLRLPGCQG